MPRRIPPLLVRFGAIPLAYFIIIVCTTTTFGGNPPLRLATAMAVVSLIKRPVNDWPMLVLAMWGAGTAAREVTSVPLAASGAFWSVTEVATIAAVFRCWGPLRSPWYLEGQALRLGVSAIFAPMSVPSLPSRKMGRL
jgi:hypothetical protein